MKKNFQEANESKTEKIRSVLATIEQMMEEGRSIDSLDTLSEEEERGVREGMMMREEEEEKWVERRGEGERVSPLEEWNTLHRCVNMNRASIKLKESSIV